MTRSLSDSLAGGSPVDWATDWLAASGFPATPANVQVVVSWEYAESGGGGGMWNPLNTTQGGYPGEWDFNSVGVKSYARRADGVAANAKVIRNGFYGPAVNAFTRGNNAQETVNAITSSPWGTRHIVLVPVPGQPPPPPIPSGPVMFDPPVALARPGGGCWIARADGIVYFVNSPAPLVTGGMVTPADRAAFAGRTVQRLIPRRYGAFRRQHGYTIVATSGETYVPATQH